LSIARWTPGRAAQIDPSACAAALPAQTAERLGSPWETALTVGQAVAGMTAHAKGIRLGIYAQPEERPHEPPPPRPEGATGAVRSLPLLGRNVPVVPTKDGLRAVSKGEIAKPESVDRYLAGKFGDQLEPARAAMHRLAASLPAEELNEQAFRLYERFRPEVPADEKGWGAKGVLDLAKIEALVKRQ
jgi:hypothetical protein